MPQDAPSGGWGGFPKRGEATGDQDMTSLPDQGAPLPSSPASAGEDPGPAAATPVPEASGESLPPRDATSVAFRPALDRRSRRLERKRHLAAAGDRELSYFTRRTGILDVLFAFLFVAVGYFAVILTYSGIGHSWDEALYLRGSTEAAKWVHDLARGQEHLLREEAIEQAWGGDFQGPLHPEIGPLPKVVTGLGTLLLPQRGTAPMIAPRIPVAAAFAFTLGLLYLMATAEYGRLGGFAAAIAYLLMPRVFGHAHIAASETLLAFTVILTAWSFLAGISRWPLALVLTAPAFALALATKVTAFFLPIPFLIWGQIYRRRDYASNLFAMLLISPLILVLLWPWLWHNGPQKLLAWLNFYAAHQSTAVYYLDKIWGYGRPNAPWHYPFVITAVALPLPTAVLAACGILQTLFHPVRRPVSVFFLLLALTFLAVSALPGSPKYDGERLFFPAFPFLALLAGGGFAGLAALARQAAFASHYREGVDPRIITRHQNMYAALVLALLTGWGVYELWRWHPNELNYFNQAVGGARGADEFGFETSYWGEGVNDEVTRFLSENLQPGEKVRVLALEGLVFEHLQRWGRLPEDVDFSPAPDEPVDWYILQNRKGFFGSRERMLFSRKPVKAFTFDGVPRILIYSGDALPAPQPPPAPAAAAPAQLASPATAPPAEAAPEPAPDDSILTVPADLITTSVLNPDAGPSPTTITIEAVR